MGYVYLWYMSMQRTNVYADADDLAMIKEGAARSGTSEAEILRHGIHIAAMSVRKWDTPFMNDDDLVDLGESVTEENIQRDLGAAADAKARKLERHR